MSDLKTWADVMDAVAELVHDTERHDGGKVKCNPALPLPYQPTFDAWLPTPHGTVHVQAELELTMFPPGE